MNNNKRPRQFSPEQPIVNQSKKQLIENNNNKQTSVVMEINQNDEFFWDKLNNVLDNKLKDVAKKDDINSIKSDIDELREENCKLRNEVKMLSSRIEQIDRRSRSSNIVVNGIVSTTTSAAKSAFNDLCNNQLGVNARVVSVRALPSNNTFLFSLETHLQAVNVLAAKSKLKGRNIFIQKDYTRDEQNIRYNLRKINKSLAKLDMNIKVRLGEFCTFIDDKKYSWSSGKLVAHSSSDAEFMKNLLSKANYNIEVAVKDNVAVNSMSLNPSDVNIQ